MYKSGRANSLDDADFWTGVNEWVTCQNTGPVLVQKWECAGQCSNNLSKVMSRDILKRGFVLVRVAGRSDGVGLEVLPHVRPFLECSLVWSSGFMACS